MASKYEGVFEELLLTHTSKHLIVGTTSFARGLREYYYRTYADIQAKFAVQSGLELSRRVCKVATRRDGIHVWLATDKPTPFTIQIIEKSGD